MAPVVAGALRVRDESVHRTSPRQHFTRTRRRAVRRSASPLPRAETTPRELLSTILSRFASHDTTDADGPTRGRSSPRGSGSRCAYVPLRGTILYVYATAGAGTPGAILPGTVAATRLPHNVVSS